MKYILAGLCLAWLLLPSSYEIRVEGPQPVPYITVQKEVKSVTVTAYNPWDPNQTDTTPCIGPKNVDICEVMKTQTVCAANFVPLGTVLELEGITCIVLDRTSTKYGDRVDVAMASYEEAVEWGKKILTMR